MSLMSRLRQVAYGEDQDTNRQLVTMADTAVRNNVSTSTFDFFSFPTELRIMIYRELLATVEIQLFDPVYLKRSTYNFLRERLIFPEILSTCKTIYEEAVPILYQNLFVINVYLAAGKTTKKKCLEDSETIPMLKWCKAIRKNTKLIKRVRLEGLVHDPFWAINYATHESLWSPMPISLGFTTKFIGRHLKNLEMLEVSAFAGIPDVWVEPVERLMKQLKMLNKVEVIGTGWIHKNDLYLRSEMEVIMTMNAMFKDMLEQHKAQVSIQK